MKTEQKTIMIYSCSTEGCSFSSQVLYRTERHELKEHNCKHDGYLKIEPEAENWDEERTSDGRPLLRGVFVNVYCVPCGKLLVSKVLLWSRIESRIKDMIMEENSE